MFRWISIGLIFASMGLWLFFALSSEPLELDLAEAPELQEESPMEIIKLELYEYKKDRESYRIFAEHALLYEKRQASFMDQVSALVYDKEAKKPTFIHSDRATMDGQTKMFTLKGEVELSYGEDTTLTTAVLYYDQNRELIFNRHPVLVESRKDEIQAKRMEYDLQKGLLTLEQPTILIHHP